MIYDEKSYEERLKDFKIDKRKKIGIYGTGKGGKIILDILKKWNMQNQVLYFIDQDDIYKDIKPIDNISVTSLSKVCSYVDVILVGSFDHHLEIEARIIEYLKIRKIYGIKVINVFSHFLEKEKQDYLDWLFKITQNLYDKSEFVEYDDAKIELSDTDPKIIAWYLPQFYNIDINDKYYGKGFTEWTNTSKMFPMYAGHFQPHIPYDTGYYTLADKSILKRQIELAKHYGVYGFGFYFYWFSGKRIMEKPLEMFLSDKDLNIPFCLTWANENWTTVWSPDCENIIFKQELLKDDAYRLAEDLLPYLSDPRYIRINNKPLLIIYRATTWNEETTRNCIETIRGVLKSNGLDIYLGVTNAGNYNGNPEELGADALIEFPPHAVNKIVEHSKEIGYLNPSVKLNVLNAEKFVNNKGYFIEHNTKNFYRGVMTTWDNSARKILTGAWVFQGLNANTFKTWLKDVIIEGKKTHESDNNLIFVNAWNEWGEGSHLEPDVITGYAMLNSLRSAIIESRKNGC